MASSQSSQEPQYSTNYHEHGPALECDTDTDGETVIEGFNNSLNESWKKGGAAAIEADWDAEDSRSLAVQAEVQIGQKRGLEVDMNSSKKSKLLLPLASTPSIIIPSIAIATTLPTASTSRLSSTATIKSCPPPPPPSQPLKVVIVDSDSENEVQIISSKPAAQPKITKAVSKQPQAKKKSPAKPKYEITSKPRSKPKEKVEKIITRKLAVEEIDKEYKRKYRLLAKKYPTLSSYVTYLSEFPRPKEIGNFNYDFKIIFLDYNQDQYHLGETFTAQHCIVKTGAELIRAEDFRKSPENADPNDHERAKRMGWTTHIVVHHQELSLNVPMGSKPPKLSLDAHILSLIGNGTLSAKDLGPYVRVVSYSWIQRSLSMQSALPTLLFELDDDPREEIPIPSHRSVKVIEKSRAEVESQSDENENIENNDGSIISTYGASDLPSNERILPPIVPSSEIAPSNQVVGDGLEISIPFGDDLETEVRTVLECQDNDSQEESDDDDPDMINYGDGENFSTDNDTDDEAAGRLTREQRHAAAEKLPKNYAGYQCNKDSDGIPVEGGPNAALAEILYKLGEIVTGLPEEIGFKKIQYRKAASAVKRHPVKLTSQRQALKVFGIGKHIAARIPEIIKTGTHRKLNANPIETKALNLFKGIYGVGGKLASAWYELGARDLEDLFTITGINLSAAQRIGIEFYDDLQLRIPRAEVTEIYEKWILKAAREIDPKLIVHCMGSYRREQNDCGDIDIMVTRDDTVDLINHRGQIYELRRKLQDWGIITHDLTTSETDDSLSFKLNGLCKLPGGKYRRLDILGVPFCELPAALIYFTGNDIFNRSLRLRARKMGYSLNEKGLSQNVTRYNIGPLKGQKSNEGQIIQGLNSEEAIFKKLGVSWRHPRLRRP